MRAPGFLAPPLVRGAGKGRQAQRAGAWVGRRLRRCPGRAKIYLAPHQPPLRVELSQHLVDDTSELPGLKLSLVPADDLAPWIDEHHRRPRPAGVVLPDQEVAIVDYRVA